MKPDTYQGHSDCLVLTGKASISSIWYIFLATFSIALFLPTSAPADTIHVPADFATIQAAIDDPNTTAGDEIVVAPGTYALTATIDFNGKAISLRSTDPNDPNIVSATILDGQDSIFHVVQCVSGEGPDTVLSGFTITGGNANGGDAPDYYGGGMYIANSSPTVSHCIFSGNSTAGVGGGMCNINGSPLVTDCVFSGNSAVVYGGGIFDSDGNLTIASCIFSGNSAGNDGGGLYNNGDAGTTIVRNSIFSDNSADDSGGGMANLGGNVVTVSNCMFNGNSADDSGGGMFNASNPSVRNCTFSGNSAFEGGGMANDSAHPTVSNCTFSNNSASNGGGGMRNLAKGPPMVINCIFWENEPDQMLNVCDRFCPFSVISFTDIQGGLPDNNTTDGGGNIDADPIFVDADGPDNIAGTEDDNLRLQLGSPCFNTGDNSVVNMGDMDLDGNPRIRHGNVDMGAYEYQSCDGYGDLDAVPGVHLGDFALFAGHWMETDCGACGGADFDGDHDVTLPDLLLQIAFWLCDGY